MLISPHSRLEEGVPEKFPAYTPSDEWVFLAVTRRYGALFKCFMLRITVLSKINVYIISIYSFALGVNLLPRMSHIRPHTKANLDASPPCSAYIFRWNTDEVNEFRDPGMLLSFDVRKYQKYRVEVRS